ncbi:MAG: hypothetical protein NUW01_09670 [Gemmatimonadaceae bacterium]|nr:hypothetical protein [Gemmatimonadaceae bacterium]
MADHEQLLAAASEAWLVAQAACPFLIPADQTDGQGKCCKHEGNTNGMGWCQPSDCPFFVE